MSHLLSLRIVACSLVVTGALACAGRVDEGPLPSPASTSSGTSGTSPSSPPPRSCEPIADPIGEVCYSYGVDYPCGIPSGFDAGVLESGPPEGGPPDTSRLTWLECESLCAPIRAPVPGLFAHCLVTGEATGPVHVECYCH